MGGLEGHRQVDQGVFDIDAGADGEQRLLVVLAMAELGMGGGEAGDEAGWIGYRLFHGDDLCGRSETPRTGCQTGGWRLCAG